MLMKSDEAVQEVFGDDEPANRWSVPATWISEKDAQQNR